MRLVGLRHDEQAARPRVEAVDDPRPQRPAGRRERHAHPQQPVHERAAAARLGRMRHEPGRLGDHEEMLVLGSGPGRARPLAGTGAGSRSSARSLPAAQPVRLRARHAVDE